eukprot:TRINITY_DN2136_c0_g1_i2.p1 TRINITY_DN2136_c0_g1~~TRINITY_DN2136_c0_g1_i2.p1  ORF type:complete len:236 (-),score=37.97 TRINITY_DN2136_c0_g1_i2:8-715(-)
METGKFVFITGLSGSGKTTLGELLKTQDGFVHFNVDVWAFGGDPILQSESVPTPEMISKRDPTIKAAFDNMAANGFTKLSANEPTDPSTWYPFFDLLCPAILSARQAVGPEKNFVVTFSVYLRHVRAYVRGKLGESLAFVVLNPSVEDVASRKVAHLRNTAESRGLTLSQFLRSFHPDSDAPEMEESAIIEILTQQARAGANGFEPASPEEPNTLGIQGMTKEEAHATTKKFLHL